MSDPETFAREMEALGPALFEEIKAGLLDYADDFVFQDIFAQLDGDPLGSRTGDLRRSFQITETGADVNSWRLSVWTDSKYAAIHEFGGTIRANGNATVCGKGKYLAIPLPAVQTQAGVTRAGPCFFKDTFVKRAKSGKKSLIIWKREGKKIKPLFVLKKEVTIPARFGLFDLWEEQRPERGRILEEAVERAHLKNGGSRG